MEKMKFAPCSSDYNEDFPEPVFFRNENDMIFMDADRYLAQATRKDRGLSVDDFFSKFAYQIDCLCEFTGVDRQRLTAQNQENGHTMLSEITELLLLQYIDPRFGPYLLARMREMNELGFTVSDRFLEVSVKERFGIPLK